MKFGTFKYGTAKYNGQDPDPKQGLSSQIGRQIVPNSSIVKEDQISDCKLLKPTSSVS